MCALSVSFSQFEAVSEADSAQDDRKARGLKDCKVLLGIQLNLNGHDSVYHLHTEQMLITPGFEAVPGHSEAF